jgi:hypothetical protein
VSFDFEILDGANSIYSATGALSLLLDPSGALAVSDLNATARGLNGLTELSYGAFLPQVDGNFAYGFAWNRTDIALPLSELAAGGSRLVSYRATVTSSTTAGCVLGTHVCLVAYSGFGDPIGRGGGVQSAFAFAAAAAATIENLNFQPAVFQIPTFDDQTNVLGFRMLDPLSSGVPEPAAWVTLILGFGLSGAALRRQRRLAPG